MHGIYGQLAYDFTKQTTANFNFRETWTEADSAGNKYNRFTPEFILMHNLDDKTMVYGKVGKSFMMPTFSQLYGGGNIIGAPWLKPSEGTHYEIGFKKNVGKNAWRVSLYQYEIKDSIESHLEDVSQPDTEVTYSNEDIRNKGIELEWTRNQSENLAYHVGVSYSHPEKRGTSEKGEQIDWHDYYGRIGFNAGVNYTTGKLTTAFNLSYLGDRTRDYAPYESLKAQLFSDLNFSYKVSDKSRFFLNIDNLFNRRDIISTSSSSFYSLGRNFMAGYEYKF